jgi:hypothetical protein
VNPINIIMGVDVGWVAVFEYLITPARRETQQFPKLSRLAKKSKEDASKITFEKNFPSRENVIIKTSVFFFLLLCLSRATLRVRYMSNISMETIPTTGSGGNVHYKVGDSLNSEPEQFSRPRVLASMRGSRVLQGLMLW